MIAVSKKVKEQLKTGINVVNYADVTLSDGNTLHLEPKDFMIGGCKIEDKTTDGKFGVGFTIGKTLTIRIANYDEKFSQYDFYQSVIYLYIAMILDDGSVEKNRKGVYYATVPSTTGEIIEISAVDGMYKLDKDYSSSTTTYPATLLSIISDVCLDCGIPIGFTQFDNMGFIVQEKPEKATYRQVLSYAAQIAGYNVRIDNDGYMKLIWYNTALLDKYNNYNGGNFKIYPHKTIISGGNFTDYSSDTIIKGALFTDEMPEHIFRIKSIDIHTDDIQITGVQVVGEEDSISLFGEKGYIIEITGNPFVYGKEEEVADYLGRRMVGIVFRPFTAQVLNNPLYEPFEVVMVSDRKGNVYYSIVNSVSYTIGSYTELSCLAEDPVKNGSIYHSEAADAVVEARRNTEKQITEYDKAVQNMNSLAMNALGFYETVNISDDGRRTIYMHDRPLLEESQYIFKTSIDGFFISQDGGKSYTAGFDKNGNAVMNVLYAIGIVADWIRSGRFECKKGDKTTFLADVDTGEVKIVADSFSLTSGETIESISQEKADNALDDAKDYADEASRKAVNNQTQEDVFNKLTNNGAVQGIYLQENKIYINASYIKTGYFSADRIQGGTLTLGGYGNVDGNLIIKNSTGEQVGYIDNTGVNFNQGTFSGKLKAATGTFLGELKAATGTFSGTITSDNGHFFAKIENAALQGGLSKEATTGYVAFNSKYTSTGIDGTRIAGKGIIALYTPYLGVGDWTELGEDGIVQVGQSATQKIITDITDNGDGTISWQWKEIEFTKGLMTTAL